MFRIGDFSRLSRVPVKTLRYYDEIGLLKPRDIDRFTRYRYYSVDQLPLLYRILGLKELGFSLDQINNLLEGDLSPDQLRKMLERRRSEIEQHIHLSTDQLAQVEARLRQIEQEDHLRQYTVILKEVQPQLVAMVGGCIPSYDQSEHIFDQLFDEVCDYLCQSGVLLTKPGIALYHEATDSDESTYVEAAMPLPKRVKGSERVRVCELPGIKSAASVVHQGSFTTLGNAYQAILNWIQYNGFQTTGPTRELYLSYRRHGNPDQYITEIQIPVTKMKKEFIMKPKITQLDKFLAVGMPYLGKNEHNEISQMWGEFIPRMSEIKHLGHGPEISYGLCFPNDQGLVDYVAALPVTQLADIPEGMVGREVPTQTYAVFEVQGLENIHSTYRFIEKEWFPNSGYQPGNGPDFELYPESFDLEKNDLLYIYFPVKKI